MADDFSIYADGLTKQYGKRTVVDGISLGVRPGEFYGFLGPNGAGKSTTIRMLCGLLPATSGTIRVAGADVSTDLFAVKRQTGYLPEDPPLYERLTSYEFLTFVGEMHGLSVADAKKRTGDLLDLLDLAAASDRYIGEYSMGMRKKTALASALIHAPRVLFLDEPFNGLDTVTVRTVTEVLQLLTAQRGVTVFFTTHVMEAVERLCQRVALLKEGRIAAEGTLDELRQAASVAGDASLEEVFFRVTDAKPPVTEAPDWLTG